MYGKSSLNNSDQQTWAAWGHIQGKDEKKYTILLGFGNMSPD